MEEDITKTPTVDLIKEYTKIDQEINLLLLRHEKIRLEIVKRFPIVEKEEEFKKKVKKI